MKRFHLQKKQFDTLFQAISFKAVLIEENGAIITAHREFLKFFGFNNKSVKGQDFMFFLSQKSQTNFKKMSFKS